MPPWFAETRENLARKMGHTLNLMVQKATKYYLIFVSLAAIEEGI